jgi:beta-fructofuranosidase
VNTPNKRFSDLIRASRQLRKVLWSDPHRPLYHLTSPEGMWNDANGTVFWKGRYHVFYLGRMPNPKGEQSDWENDWLPAFEHASSKDLLHWVHHPPAILPAFDGSTPRGIYSGDLIEGAPIPTLIYHVPGQGTCIARSEDDDLIEWAPVPENPVITEVEDEEYRVFDPCAWYDNGVYYALIGNKNGRTGYEGDCTSLFRSDNALDWSYLGPFYKSNREWTEEIEDCACPDFFQIGDRHVLLMHGHRPYGMAHFYLGRVEDEVFFPESHGRMNWPGGQLSAPETLLDPNGRRLMFAWVREARPWEDYGWASVMSCPRELTIEDGELLIRPAEELKSLRRNHRRESNIILSGRRKELAWASGSAKEIDLVFRVETAEEVGVCVRSSPSQEEKTLVVWSAVEQTLRVELDGSTLDENVQYLPWTKADLDEEGRSFKDCQIAPLEIESGNTLRLRVFLDQSILEVFANDRLCLTNRIYPTRADSVGVAVFAHGGTAMIESIDAWDMERVNSW